MNRTLSIILAILVNIIFVGGITLAAVYSFTNDIELSTPVLMALVASATGLYALVLHKLDMAS